MPWFRHCLYLLSYLFFYLFFFFFTAGNMLCYELVKGSFSVYCRTIRKLVKTIMHYSRAPPAREVRAWAEPSS